MADALINPACLLAHQALALDDGGGCLGGEADSAGVAIDFGGGGNIWNRQDYERFGGHCGKSLSRSIICIIHHHRRKGGPRGPRLPRETCHSFSSSALELRKAKLCACTLKVTAIRLMAQNVTE